MTLIEKIREVMKKQGMTQLSLATAVGVAPSAIGNYLYEKRKPNALICLQIAAVCESQADREFFLKASKLNDFKLSLIGTATASYAIREAKSKRA